MHNYLYLSTLRWLIILKLNIIINDNFESISKTKLRKPIQSSVVGPRTCVEPTNGPLVDAMDGSEYLDQVASICVVLMKLMPPHFSNRNWTDENYVLLKQKLD